MGADQNFVQGAEVFRVAVISALLNGAFDALIGVAVHSGYLLLLSSQLV